MDHQAKDKIDDSEVDSSADFVENAFNKETKEKERKEEDFRKEESSAIDFKRYQGEFDPNDGLADLYVND